MIVEIFTALVRNALADAGGELPSAELTEVIEEELALTALAGAPRQKVDDVLAEVCARGPVIAVGDQVVDLTVAAEHQAFTHQITEDEIHADRLDLDADLAVLARVAEADGGLHLPDGAPLRLVTDRHPRLGPGGSTRLDRSLAGPAGWLRAFAPGSVVVASAADGYLSLRPLADDEAQPTDDAVGALAEHLADDLLAAAAEANGGDHAPLGVEELQAAGLVDGWFEPGPDRPPFGRLLDAGGWERSGNLVGRAGQWERHGELERTIGVLARHGDHLEPAERDAILGVIDAFEAWRTDPSSTPDRAPLVRLHRSAEAALCLEEELVRADPEGTDLVGFLAAFDRPAGTVAAVLDTFRALASDLAGHGEEAEALLDDARRAAPEWFPATEARAHLHEVRGQAQEALNLLQTTRTANDGELQVLRLRAKLANASVGRNDPCPCGSGRKYKQCHQGQTLLPAEVQVTWLLDKARAHVDRLGPLALTDRLPARSDLHADAELMALDAVLFGLGGLARFLDARRSMLPADEVALAEAWLADNRPGLYRVVGGDYGDRVSTDDGTVVLVDVATEEAFQVHGTDRFHESELADVVWCRLLPDGERWWTSGFARTVEPDELAIVAAATGADPLDLHRALLGLPVSLRVDAPDGAPLVTATASWSVDQDRETVEAALDQHAERHDDHWELADPGDPDGSPGAGTIRLLLMEPLDPELLDPELAADLDDTILSQRLLLASTDSIPSRGRAMGLVEGWFPSAELHHVHTVPLARSRAESQDEELLEMLYAIAPDDLAEFDDLDDPDEGPPGG